MYKEEEERGSHEGPSLLILLILSSAFLPSSSSCLSPCPSSYLFPQNGASPMPLPPPSSISPCLSPSPPLARGSAP